MNPEDFDLIVDENEIADHLFNELIILGYSPTAEEVEDLAGIMSEYIMDLLIDAGLIDHFQIDEYEEGEN